MFKRFLDPKNDYAFKKIFGAEKNKDILIHFLNDVLDHSTMGTIQEVELLDKELAPEVQARKQSFLDILCTDDKGNTYIVEMQVARNKYFIKRAQFYAGKAYGSQLKAGEGYENLKEVIFLAITDFVLFPDKPGYKSTHGIFDQKSWTQDLKDFHFTFVELPKFTKDALDLESMEDKWCYFFKHATEATEGEIEDLAKNSPIILRAFDAADEAGWSEKELAEYEKRLKDRRDADAQLQTAMEEGEQKGIEKGVDKGREEERLSVAKNMLEIGLPLDTIQKATGLSLEQIQKLKS